jgi:hypothetical protein
MVTTNLVIGQMNALGFEAEGREEQKLEVPDIHMTLEN